jgi:type II secretory ATPase GspE/PulE/Tfp pilus assembly ATPase PilB-like protein
VLVGEIRDFETAEIAIKAALTGHLVLSTLHTNDAPSTVSRLVNMGIEPFWWHFECQHHPGTAAYPPHLQRL